MRKVLVNTCNLPLVRLLVLSSFLSAVLACGGGGGSDGQNPNQGSGWVEITRDPAMYRTEQAWVSLGGSSFTPDGSQCTYWIWPVQGTLPPGYQVTWSNSANGTNGFASAMFACFLFFYGTSWDTYYIPLAMGDNPITVTASDGMGNVGRDTVVITRVPDTTPPEVTGTTPPDGGSIDENSSFTVDFSEAMDPASISNTTVQLYDGSDGPVSGSVTYAYRRATFLPAAPLQVGQVYSAAVTTGAKDLVGNGLAAPYTWSFTVIPDITPPTVIQTAPYIQEKMVSTRTAIKVRFSERMDPATISAATIQLKDNTNAPVSGTVYYSDATYPEAMFVPSAELQYAIIYSASVTTGAQDRAGNALAADYTWSFTTGQVSSSTPLSVSYTDPFNGTTCVATETIIEAWFNKDIDGLGVNTSSFFLRDDMGNPVAGTAYRYMPGFVLFTPNSPLASSTTYTATLTTAIKDLSGYPLASDYAWRFTTQPSSSGSWNAVTTNGAPAARYRHSSVWTGTEMIVWGGDTGNDAFFGDGGRYNPAADAWTPVSNTGAPSARIGHVAVWTGSKKIVWGGVQWLGPYLNSGALYDPAADTWEPMTTSGAPSPRYGALAVWTGTEMIVWGGGNDVATLGNGGRYNPSTNLWSSMSTTGAPAVRSGQTAIWTGAQLLVWGGVNSGATVTGGIYTPATDTWTPIATAGAPSGRNGHSAVWTGSEMLIWGGWDGTQAVNTGARYDPATNTWQAMSAACAPLARYAHTGVWSGTDMIVWGGTPYLTGGQYNPVTDTWKAVPAAGMPDLRMSPATAWTGTDMLIWGGRDATYGSLHGDGGRFRP